MPDPGKRLSPLLRDLVAMLVKSRAAVITLGLCLVLAVAAIYFATTVYSDLPMTTGGLIAMIIGVVVTLAVGIGLMALIFYSSRAGYDEPPELDNKDDDRKG
jgi:hypothetical protein